jgi:membrane fusion protein (multidrug efflux system)
MGALALAGCPAKQAGSASKASSAPAPTNRIAVPIEVRDNLGITFVEARRGRVESRMRVPGRLEAPRDGRWTVRAPAPGRVLLTKQRLDRVEAGEVIAQLTTPKLLATQADLADAENAVDRALLVLARLAAEGPALSAYANALESSVADMAGQLEAALALRVSTERLETEVRARVEELTRIGADNGLSKRELFDARQTHAEAELRALTARSRVYDLKTRASELRLQAATARSRVQSLKREVRIADRERLAAERDRNQHLESLATMTGTPVSELLEPTGDGPRWERLKQVPLRAPGGGTIVELPASAGEWLEGGAAVALIVSIDTLVFRGQVPEGDLARIRSGAPVRIEPFGPGIEPIESVVIGPLPLSNSTTRSVLIEARLPNAGGKLPDGMSATAHILLGQSENEETLIPEAALVQDDLEWVLFRRDPSDPDTVIRTPVSLGRRSDGWVEVLDGVIEGDQLVREGIHQLKQTGIGKATSGHFHADGSWHDEEE